jgi:hypothetical protein
MVLTAWSYNEKKQVSIAVDIQGNAAVLIGI